MIKKKKIYLSPLSTFLEKTNYRDNSNSNSNLSINQNSKKKEIQIVINALLKWIVK